MWFCIAETCYNVPLLCVQLLREIPPDGDKFATMVEVDVMSERCHHTSLKATLAHLKCCALTLFPSLTAYSWHRGELE